MIRDVLQRYSALYTELDKRRRWHTGPTAFRYAAMTLVDADGEPYAIADRLFRAADALSERASWFGPLRGNLRFSLAAALVCAGESAERFRAEFERASARFRERGIRRGGGYEAIAILVLWQHAEHGRIQDAQIARFGTIYEMMKSHHWWLTGPDDFAACALLTTRHESPHDMARRIEHHHAALRRAGLPNGDALQIASHLLFFHPAGEHEATRKFLDLHARFRDSGVRMWQSDFDELALLALLDDPAERVVRRVVALREQVKAIRPQPSVTMSFSVAASLVVLESFPPEHPVLAIRAVHDLQQVQSSLEQQAATAAAAT